MDPLTKLPLSMTGILPNKISWMDSPLQQNTDSVCHCPSTEKLRKLWNISIVFGWKTEQVDKKTEKLNLKTYKLELVGSKHISTQIEKI